MNGTENIFLVLAVTLSIIALRKMTDRKEILLSVALGFGIMSLLMLACLFNETEMNKGMAHRNRVVIGKNSDRIRKGKERRESQAELFWGFYNGDDEIGERQ